MLRWLLGKPCQAQRYPVLVTVPEKSRWKVDASQAITALAAVAAVIASLYVARLTFSEGQRLSWLNSLETRAAEIGKGTHDSDIAYCIYDRADIKDGNTHCRDTIFKDRANLAKAIDFAEQVVDLIVEAKTYADQFDQADYYDTWYKDWAYTVSEDPHGVVGHVLWLRVKRDANACKRFRDAGVTIDPIENERKFQELQDKHLPAYEPPTKDAAKRAEARAR